MANAQVDTQGLHASSAVRHDEDLAVARAILSGDEATWTSFVERYSPLIRAVIRRYVRSRDREVARTIYADTLEAIYKRKLRTYEGRAALSTWTALVARTEVMDHLRRSFGRHELPRAFHRLDEKDQLIFRLYYVEGRDFEDVKHLLSSRDPSWTAVRVAASLQRIEDRLNDGWLRRVAYDVHAQSTGAASGRLLEYLDHVRAEYKQNQGGHSPEYHLMEREARRTVSHVRAVLDRLPPAEKKLMVLRFERGWSARRIADELGLRSPRNVYTVIDRIIRRLRRMFGPRRGEQR